MSSDDERKRLSDIVENIDRLQGHIAGLVFEDFANDAKTTDAVERCLQRITEAAIKIGHERMAIIAPDIPLAPVRGLGNALRHSYDVIDPETIWLTALESLPPLRAACIAASA